MHLTAQKYQPEKHLKTIQDYHMLWAIGEYPWECLPELGYVVFDEKDKFIACGFIRSAEGHVMMTDLFLSNPSRETKVRCQVKIAFGIIMDEMEQGVPKDTKVVMGWSSVPMVVEHAKEHGFSVIPTNVLLRVK